MGWGIDVTTYLIRLSNGTDDDPPAIYALPKPENRGIAHFAVRARSLSNPNYRGDDVLICENCGIHSTDFATTPCRPGKL